MGARPAADPYPSPAHGWSLSAQTNDLDVGVRALERVPQAEPGDRQAACALGSAYIKNGPVARAERLVDERPRHDESPEAPLIRGSVHLTKKDERAARTVLERSLESRMEWPAPESQIGLAWLHAGQTDHATLEFQAEFAINPRDFNANAFLGWIVQQDEDSQLALDLLQAAYAVDEPDLGCGACWRKSTTPGETGRKRSCRSKRSEATSPASRPRAGVVS